jgi:hypothetical protein
MSNNPPTPNQKQPESSSTVRAIVARGRTIDVPTGQRKLAGLTNEGKEVFRQAVKTFGPGQTVDLPRDEAKSLRNLGYLVDPDAVAIPTGEGPSFGSNEPGQARAA